MLTKERTRTKPRKRAPRVYGALFFVGLVLCFIGWVTFPEHAPFSIKSHEQFQVSAPFTAAGVMCLLVAGCVLAWDIDRRWRNRKNR